MIAIIALLMSILMPALARVRNQAKNVLCQSNLKQWGICFGMYADEWEGSAPRGWWQGGDTPGPFNTDCWMEALRPGVTAISTTCDAAQPQHNLRVTLTARGALLLGRARLRLGASFLNRTAVASLRIGGHPQQRVIMAATAGTALFVTLPTKSTVNRQAAPGGMPPSKYNWKRADVKGAAAVPLLGDHKWLDCWPHHGDTPPEYDRDAITSQMSRVCMNRHEGYVGWVFLDYTARLVGLKELWKLKWSRPFDTDAGPTKQQWPEWMKRFKDYD